MKTFHLLVSSILQVSMIRPSRWILAICYYFSLLLGILSFGYDPKTGKVYTSRILSIYCGIINVGMCGILPLIFTQLHLSPGNFLKLHFPLKVRIIVCCIRMVAILLTIFLNWTKREEFMRTLNYLQDMRSEFRKMWPLSGRVERYFDRAIVLKFVVGLIANFCISMESSAVGHPNSQWSQFWIGVIDSLAIILSVIMTHYYNTISNVSVMQMVIREELLEILLKSQMLSHCRNRNLIKHGIFVRQSEKLAKLLNELASAQYQLEQLVCRINAMYDIQGVCVLITIYLNNMVFVFIWYLLLGKMYDLIQWNQWAAIFVPFTFGVIYADLLIFRFGLLRPVDLARETGQLLRDGNLMCLRLDKSLEESVSFFFLTS